MGGCQRDGERGEGKNKKRGGGEEELGKVRSTMADSGTNH